MAFENPTFNLKTGVDTTVVVAREDKDGNIVYRDGFYRGPYLLRRTGDSLKGSTESITSNELRPGRTRSAPRKGNSSSEGSLDIEFSPESFDDMLSAAWRGEWKTWVNDTASPCNKDKVNYANGYFGTKWHIGTDGKKVFGAKKLLRKYGDYDVSSVNGKEVIKQGGVEVADPNSVGLYEVSDPAKFVIHELNPETSKVQYSILKKFGGQDNEDMFQEYAHVSMNTFQLTVAVNSIITGSFGTMGLNNPKILRNSTGTDGIEALLGKRLKEKKGGTAITDVVEAGTEYLGEIPEKALDTLALTAREGSFYVNGKRVRFASNLTFNINNNLSTEFAIFESQAISTKAGMLDIDGDLTTYLVHDNKYAEDGADELYNAAVDDETIELLFCLQDKLGDTEDTLPEALYIFQIFNAKHTDVSVDGNGEDSLDVSLPWQSFNEQACRVFKCILPRPVEVSIADDFSKVVIVPNTDLTGLETADFTAKATGLTVTVKAVDGAGDEIASVTADATALNKTTTDDYYGYIETTIDGSGDVTTGATVTATVKWNGHEITVSKKKA